jgi:hypothetical protein
MLDWKAYQSHKVVHAAKICRVETVDGETRVFVRPYDDDRVERFYPSENGMAARAEVDGYAVVYDADGPRTFHSISPRDKFEEGYLRVETPPCEKGCQGGPSE